MLTNVFLLVLRQPLEQPSLVRAHTGPAWHAMTIFTWQELQTAIVVSKGCFASNNVLNVNIIYYVCVWHKGLSRQLLCRAETVLLSSERVSYTMAALQDCLMVYNHIRRIAEQDAVKLTPSGPAVLPP
jgi:hypothetical protein